MSSYMKKLKLLAAVLAVFSFSVVTSSPVKAQGLPVMDLTSIANTILQTAQDAMASGIFGDISTLTGAVENVQQIRDKIESVKNVVAWLQVANRGAQYAQQILFIGTDMWRQYQMFVNFANSMSRSGVDTQLVLRVTYLARNFMSAVTSILNMVKQLYTMVSSMVKGQLNPVELMDKCNQIEADARAQYNDRLQQIRSDLRMVYLEAVVTQELPAYNNFMNMLFY